MKKNILNLLFLPALLVFMLASCKKDGTMIIAQGNTPAALTASSNNLDYTEADSAKTAVTFTRTTSDFGYPAAVNYTLEFSSKGSDFQKVTSYTMSKKTMDFTVGDFNTLALGLKYATGVLDTIYARVRSEAADSLFSYSKVVKIRVTPYAVAYPFLYVPGAYQGWAPDGNVIAKLYSPGNDGVYTGYVNLPDADNPFKLTPAPNWDNSYGMLNASEMAYNGGDNFDIKDSGYYLIKANTNDGTWSAALQNWSIIGDFNDWARDVSFEFDEKRQVLVKTLQLPAGAFKFRANGATEGWNINLGSDMVGLNEPFTLKPDGDNINISTAGKYKITLDLRVPSEPYCTLVKQ